MERAIQLRQKSLVRLKLVETNCGAWQAAGSPGRTSSITKEADLPAPRRKLATASPPTAVSGTSLLSRKATRSAPSDANTHSRSERRSMRWPARP